MALVALILVGGTVFAQVGDRPPPANIRALSPNLAMIVDGVSDTAVVFDTATDTVVGAVALGSSSLDFADCGISQDGRPRL